MANKFIDNNGLSYFWTKIKALFAGKVDKVDGKGLSTNDYTDAEQTKLNGIEAGANKTTVDSALSTSSTNPVQNKVINTALGNKVDKVSGKGLSANDFTNAHLDKLNNLPTSAEMSQVFLQGAKVDGVQQPVSAGVLNIDLSNYAKKSDIGSAFYYGGSIEAGDLAGVELQSAKEGTIFNVATEFTTTDLFAEGAGKTYPAGTNIIRTDSTGIAGAKYDVLSGFVDLSPYMKSADMVALSNSEIDTILAS